MDIRILSGAYIRGYFDIPTMETASLYNNLSEIADKVQYDQYMASISDALTQQIIQGEPRVQTILNYDYPWSFDDLPSEEEFLQSTITAYARWATDWTAVVFIAKNAFPSILNEMVYLDGGSMPEEMEVFLALLRGIGQSEETQVDLDHESDNFFGENIALNDIPVSDRGGYEKKLQEFFIVIREMLLVTVDVASYSDKKIFFSLGDMFFVLINLDDFLRDPARFSGLALGSYGLRGIKLLQAVMDILQNFRAIVTSIIATSEEGLNILRWYENTYNVSEIIKPIDYAKEIQLNPWQQSQEVGQDVQAIWQGLRVMLGGSPGQNRGQKRPRDEGWEREE